MTENTEDREARPCRHCQQPFESTTYLKVVGLCSGCERIWARDNRPLARILKVALDGHIRIVYKGWGAEIWIVNHSKYCIKYLFFFAGKQFSDHYHPIKQEIWQFLWGDFYLYLDGDSEPQLVHSGHTVEIIPGRRHQLFACEDAVLLEVSTEHFEADSIRISQGD